MPPTATLLTSGASTANATSYATASITPGANRLILAFVAHAADVPSLSGNGLTWVQEEGGFLAAENPDRGLYVFRAMGGAPSAGAVTIGFGASQARCCWAIAELAAVDTSGSDGSGAVVQSVYEENGEVAATSGSVTLAALGSASNAVIAAFAHVAQEATTHEGGYTELADVSAGESQALMVEFDTAGDTTPSASWATSVRWMGLGLEIKAVAARSLVPARRRNPLVTW